MKKRRHGNARLLSVQQGKAVMYVPGQGFRPFHFGAVFGEDSGQEAVWRHSAHDAVIGALNGFNACLICYGQTGSGETGLGRRGRSHAPSPLSMQNMYRRI